MRRQPFPQPLIYLLVFLLALAALGRIGLFRPLRALVEEAAIIPLRQQVYDLRRFFKKDLGSCQLANERQLAELRAKIASLTEETASQRRLLSAPLPKNWQFLEAKVIGLEGEELIINQGDEEIFEGMVAIFGDSYLGRVVRVSEKMARVRMAAFPEERLVVRVATEGGVLAQGLLVGRGEGKARLEQVLASERLERGALAYGNFEGGDLLVGEIEEVLAPAGEVFKSAVIKRLFNPEELVTIFLIRGRI